MNFTRATTLIHIFKLFYFQIKFSNYKATVSILFKSRGKNIYVFPFDFGSVPTGWYFVFYYYLERQSAELGGYEILCMITLACESLKTPIAFVGKTLCSIRNDKPSGRQTGQLTFKNRYFPEFSTPPTHLLEAIFLYLQISRNEELQYSFICQMYASFLQSCTNFSSIFSLIK